MRWNCLCLHVLIELGTMKKSAVWINSQISNNMAHDQIMQKAQNHEVLRGSYLVQLSKHVLIKRLNVLLVIKLFHCYVIALAQGGNNSNVLLLCTFRCFQVHYRWLLCLGKIFRLTKLSIPGYSPCTKRNYSIAYRTNFHENIPRLALTVLY